MTPVPDWIPLLHKAIALAQSFGQPMAVGWQQNDDTGENEPGWCPLHAAGPCFVHTVVAVVRP